MASGAARTSSSGTVGVAMATFNGERYLREMLSSLEGQTRVIDRIIVSDDHSTDDTVTIIQDHPSSARCRVALNPGRGLVSNFDHAIQLCDAEYVALSDQDDFWCETKIEDLLNAMHDAEARFGRDVPILVYSDLEIVDAELRTIVPSFYRSSLKRPDTNKLSDFLLDGHIPGCAMLLNDALVRLALPLPTLHVHDWWIEMLAAALGRLVYVDKPLVKYRQHDANVVGLGNLGKNRISAVLARPVGFARDRYRMLRKRARDVRAHLEALDQRYGDRLSPQDRRLLKTVLDGSPLARLRVFDRRRMGVRLPDLLALALLI